MRISAKNARYLCWDRRAISEHFFRGALPITVAGDHRPAVATVL